MNFRRILTRKLAMVIPVTVIAALAIALVAVPAGAINQAPAPPGFGEVLNSPVPVPTMINYQGYLTDSGGDPITGALEMTFAIYDVPTEGVPLWTETHPSVTVTDGLFNVLLGSLNPISTSHLTGESYLGIKVGADAEMTPRQPMVSVAYALVADNLDGMDSGDFVAVAGDTMTGQLVLPVDGLVAGKDQLVLTGGKVGIGTASPTYQLDVIGIIRGTNSNDNYGALGTNACGVYGEHGTSGNYGQLGTSSYGVYGNGDFGVYGASKSGTGVYGTHTGSSNFGRLGTSGYGAMGVSASDTGVYGLNSKSGNYGYLGASDEGVYGEYSSGNYGRLGISIAGVYGYYTNGNNGQLGTESEGVYGHSESGYGVFGDNSGGNWGSLASINEGAYGRNTNGNYGQLGTTSEGVCGISTSGYGVYGKNSSSGNYGRLGVSLAGVNGYNSNGNNGQLGTSNEGVYGEYSANGNYGQVGTFGCGVYGEYSNTGNYGKLGTGDYGGVYGEDGSSGNNGMLGTLFYGVYGRHNDSGNYGHIGTGDYGVSGYSNNDTGVYGENNDSGNYGKLGTSDHGVYGNCDTGGIGVGGYNGYSGTGVYGESTGGIGVSGRSANNNGVHGYSYNDIGVRGDGSNYGVYGRGDTGVYGYGESGGYDFYAAGPGENYGPFTGGHEVKLSAGFPEDFKSGLIVSVTGETQVRTDEGEITFSSTLPTVQLADTPNDIKVAGVLISESPLPEDHWYQVGEGERFGIVNALGEGRVWVTNINGDIEAGHYITTSSIAGYGQKQDDDLLHSYTLGKAIENVDWSQVTETVEYDGQTYKAYAIAVFYTSG